MDKIKDISNKNLKFENLKDVFYNKTINIYSCGPSFIEFKDKLPVDKNTIKVCIKSTIFEIENADILIYDNRIKAGLRKNHDYSNCKDIITIYMGDYYFENFSNHVKSLGSHYHYPIGEKLFMEPDITFTCDENYSGYPTIFKREYNGIIYGNYNIYVPLIYRLLFLFNFMGAKKFNITGWDGINSNFTQNHFYDKEQILGNDTILTYYESLLIDHINLGSIVIYSNNSNENLKIKRYMDIDMSYHILKNLSLSYDKFKFLKYSDFLFLNFMLKLSTLKNKKYIFDEKLFIEKYDNKNKYFIFNYFLNFI